eukprot:7445597-Alexandrium_andersonii.AAC.1
MSSPPTRMTFWRWPGSSPLSPGLTWTRGLPRPTTWWLRCSAGWGSARGAAWTSAGGGASWPPCSRTRSACSRRRA